MVFISHNKNLVVLGKRARKAVLGPGYGSGKVVVVEGGGLCKVEIVPTLDMEGDTAVVNIQGCVQHLNLRILGKFRDQTCCPGKNEGRYLGQKNEYQCRYIDIFRDASGTGRD